MDNQRIANKILMEQRGVHWQYMRYIESINANGDPRVTILSFSEWLNDGKPGPLTVR